MMSRTSTVLTSPSLTGRPPQCSSEAYLLTGAARHFFNVAGCRDQSHAERHARMEAPSGRGQHRLRRRSVRRHAHATAKRQRRRARTSTLPTVRYLVTGPSGHTVLPYISLSTCASPA
jgi:hypothetical protein